MLWPSRAARFTSSGHRSAWRPSTKNVARTPSAPNASRIAGVARAFGPSSNVRLTTASVVDSRRWTRPNSGLFRSYAPHASAPADSAVTDAMAPITDLPLRSRGQTVHAENLGVQPENRVAHARPTI